MLSNISKHLLLISRFSLIAIAFSSCSLGDDQKITESVIIEMKESSAKLKQPLLEFKYKQSDAGGFIQVVCYKVHFYSEEYVQFLISYLIYHSKNVTNLNSLKIEYSLENSSDSYLFEFTKEDIDSIKDKYESLEGLSELVKISLSECQPGYFQTINFSMKVVGEKFPEYAYQKTFSYLLVELLKDSRMVAEEDKVSIAMFNYYQLVILTDMSDEVKYKELAKYLRKIWKCIFGKSFDKSIGPR